MKLNWVTIKVKDMEKSLHFYNDLLGLSISRRFKSGDLEIAFLGKEDHAKIELIQSKEPVPDNPGTGVSIGLEPYDLDELVGRLKKEEYTLNGPIAPNPDIRFFYLEDPDGYTIQLVEQIFI